MGLLVRRTGRIVGVGRFDRVGIATVVILVVTVVVWPKTVILDLVGRLVAVVLVSVVALMGRLWVVVPPLVLVGVVILVLINLAAAVVVLHKCSLCSRREDDQSGGGDGQHDDLAGEGGGHRGARRADLH